MLHGYLASKECFLKQIRFFSAFYKVVAVDMTGFGESPGMGRPYSVDDYKNEIRRVVDELGVEKYNILAHSFGARVTMKLAAEDKRINRIIFTGAAGLKPRRSLKYFFKRASFLMLRRLVPKEKLERFYSPDYRVLSPVMKESFKKIVSENLEFYAERITAKTLIISGKKDAETPPYSQKKLCRLINGSRLMFIDGGHFCFADNPSKFNAAAFSFLAEG